LSLGVSVQNEPLQGDLHPSLSRERNGKDVAEEFLANAEGAVQDFERTDVAWVASNMPLREAEASELGPSGSRVSPWLALRAVEVRIEIDDDVVALVVDAEHGGVVKFNCRSHRARA
jgi:hypothetical protein